MPLSSLPHVRGLLLAAGSGSRMGGPKALLRSAADGSTWVERAVQVLLAGGCAGVTVVVGAQAQAVIDVLRPDPTRSEEGAGADEHEDAEVEDGEVEDGEVEVVTCEGWAEGMGASLRAGLVALQGNADIDAVLITLVDLPDVGPDVVRRLHSSIERSASGQWRGELSRAAYGGVPGHPTLIGRDHWDGVIAVARGDRGARDYLRAHPHRLVECGDLARGHDVDSPAGLDD